PSALSGLLICWCRRGQWRGRGGRPSLPSLYRGEGEAPSPVGPVARISEAHPGSPRAGPWRVPDAAFGLIRATRPLMSTRLVASPLAVERGVHSGQAEALQDTAQCARIAYAVGVQAGAARALHVDEQIVDEKGLAGV